MIDYTAILTRRYRGKEWILNGDNYDGLTWLSETTPPTKAELDALWPAVQTELANEAASKATARANALAKLADLGLTQAEIEALVG